jgi:hypothetical protein
LNFYHLFFYSMTSTLQLRLRIENVFLAPLPFLYLSLLLRRNRLCYLVALLLLTVMPVWMRLFHEIEVFKIYLLVFLFTPNRVAIGYYIAIDDNTTIILKVGVLVQLKANLNCYPCSDTILLRSRLQIITGGSS